MRGVPIQDAAGMSQDAEFEMLVNVLIAHQRVLDATGWVGKGSKFLPELSQACSALLSIKEMCSEETQRRAEGQVFG